MLKTRIALIVVSAIVIWLIFLLPKVVVDNGESQLSANSSAKQQPAKSDVHTKAPQKLLDQISNLREKYLGTGQKEKNAIFADSLTTLYAEAGKFDSAA